MTIVRVWTAETAALHLPSLNWQCKTARQKESCRLLLLDLGHLRHKSPRTMVELFHSAAASFDEKKRTFGSIETRDIWAEYSAPGRSPLRQCVISCNTRLPTQGPPAPTSHVLYLATPPSRPATESTAARPNRSAHTPAGADQIDRLRSPIILRTCSRPISPTCRVL